MSLSGMFAVTGGGSGIGRGSAAGSPGKARAWPSSTWTAARRRR